MQIESSWPISSIDIHPRDMNLPNIATSARASAWDLDLGLLAARLRDQLVPIEAAASTTVWWGAGFSDLMLHARPTLPAQHHNEVVGVDVRQSRRAMAWAGAAAETHRLLNLFDLRRDAAAMQAQLQRFIVRDLDGYLALDESLSRHFDSAPCLADGCVDTLVADFVMNRLTQTEAALAMAEAFRVLRRNGRFFCAMLVGDAALAQPSEVRSAPGGRRLRVPDERSAVQTMEDAGFHGIVLHWTGSDNPTAVDRIDDSDVRMAVLEAYKGKQGPCFELGQAVVYRGPWRQVSDDDGHVYPRGERVAVCAKTYALLMREPYGDAFIGLRSINEPELKDAVLFDCHTPAVRDPRITKGLMPFAGAVSAGPGACCPEGGGC